MLAVISSWISNTSFISRSKRSDQTWYPSETLTSWAVMRSRLPDFWTLPSRIVSTLSFVPISRMSICFPLKANAEVRAVTRRVLILVRALMSSSASPSQR